MTPNVDLDDPEAVEAVRRAYYPHEKRVKAVGIANLILAFLWLPAVITSAMLALGVDSAQPGRRNLPDRSVLIEAAFLQSLGFALNLALGMGLRRLYGWARWGELALIFALLALVGLLTTVSLVEGTAHFGLMAFAVAPLALIVVLVAFLLAPKTRFVCSPTYRRVVERTPLVPLMIQGEAQAAEYESEDDTR